MLEYEQDWPGPICINLVYILNIKHKTILLKQIWVGLFSHSYPLLHNFEILQQYRLE